MEVVPGASSRVSQNVAAKSQGSQNKSIVASQVMSGK